ncbi:NUDIX domain-containing protein [Sporosalibacterium faouarense]|uniref:NUDIX domain-containing protein n=1 Tax=Sporosalibacterium faouarense TaxID=516123 RepID=UPI00141CF078|nr:NUDIX domain-containing protein [Sporosalibacterium faouarense]MTI47916.1 NUDIX domain-containing protein [Bacillota bacterium]
MKTQVFGEKNKGIEYIERKGVYGISFNSDKQVALVKLPNGYFLPGGGIENDESHISCLEREFIEETGYEIEMGEYVDCLAQYTYSNFREMHFKLVGYFYLVNMKESIYEKTELDHELVWRDITDIQDIMSLEYQAWIVNKVYKDIYCN